MFEMKAKKGRKKMATIEIEIEVRAASIVCTSNAGNVRGGPGTEIRWKTKDTKREFTLEFFTLTVGAEDSPFESGEESAVVTARQPFRATLKKWVGEKELGLYEYNITTGTSLKLDPVIVMDRE
jgi:hypothetical protein